MPKRKRCDCTICLSSIKNEAALDGCSHTFCRKCIVKWSKTENSCPQCRSSFTTVTTKKSTKRIRTKRQSMDADMTRIMNEALWRFVIDDDFKFTLAYRFVYECTPFVTFLCQALDCLLSDSVFIENIKQYCDEEGYTNFKDNLDGASRYIERLMNLNRIISTAI